VITDLPLDPLVVNLADEGGHSYARLGLTLQIANPSARAGSESADAAGAATDMRDTLRDQIISVLHLQQSTGLLAPNGKDHLKQAIERPSPLRT
jgi:flagellar basal body-associated protein FliL